MTAALLKAYGWLPQVEMEDVHRLSVDVAPYEVVLKDRFCSCPDYADPEIADADPGEMATELNLEVGVCRALITNHQRMIDSRNARLEATGRGSFPVGCDPKHPEIHTAKYYVDVDSFNSHWKSTVATADLDTLVGTNVWGSREEIYDRYNGKSILDVACLLCERTYLRRGIKWKKIESATGDNLHMKSKHIAGSVIGYAYYNSRVCDSHSLCVLDSSYNRSLGPTVMLMSHEWGHVNNCDHEFANQRYTGAVMGYSPKFPYVGFSTGKSPYDRPLDPSIRKLTNFYGDPLPETDGPIIPPTPPSSPITVTGTLTTDVPTAVRGELLCRSTGPGEQRVIIVPDGAGGYKPTARAS